LYWEGLTDYAKEEPRGHPAKPYYEATDGVGFLLYALLELDQVEKRPNEVLAKRAILIGEGKDKVRIGFDNW